jgi:hypothetical protein
MPARLARIVLAVALLAAWQAALQHPVEHVDELGRLVHLYGGHSDEGAPLCDELAALTACAASAPVLLGAQISEFEAPWRARRAPRAAEAPPFLSQGPPAA